MEVDFHNLYCKLYYSVMCSLERGLDPEANKRYSPIGTR